MMTMQPGQASRLGWPPQQWRPAPFFNRPCSLLESQEIQGVFSPQRRLGGSNHRQYSRLKRWKAREKPGLPWHCGLALEAALATRLISIRIWTLMSQAQQFVFSEPAKQSNSENPQGKRILNIQGCYIRKRDKKDPTQMTLPFCVQLLGPIR